MSRNREQLHEMVRCIKKLATSAVAEASDETALYQAIHRYLQYLIGREVDALAPARLRALLGSLTVEEVAAGFAGSEACKFWTAPLFDEQESCLATNRTLLRAVLYNRLRRTFLRRIQREFRQRIRRVLRLKLPRHCIQQVQRHVLLLKLT